MNYYRIFYRDDNTNQEGEKIVRAKNAKIAEITFIMNNRSCRVLQICRSD